MSHTTDEDNDIDEHQSTRTRLLANHDRSNEQSHQSTQQSIHLPSISSSNQLNNQASNQSPYSSGRWSIAFLALFSTICTLTGLILLDPHLVSSVINQSISHTITQSNNIAQSLIPSHYSSAPQIAVQYVQPPCHATIDNTIARVLSSPQWNNQSIIQPQSSLTTYILLGCAMEQVRSPPGSCQGHHVLQESLLMLGMIVQLSVDQSIKQPIKYVAGTFFDRRTDWDQFVGINDGEIHLIDITIDARTPMDTVDNLSINQTNVQLTERSQTATSSIIYHVNQFNPHIILDEFSQSDKSIMSVVSSILSVKYCYARSLRPQLVDLYAHDRFDRLVDGLHDQAAFKDFIPHQLTYDTRFTPLVIAVTINNTNSQSIDRALETTYQTVTLLMNQQPSIQAMSVHVFFEYNDQPVDQSTFVKGYQAIKQLLINQVNKQSITPSFHIHYRPTTSRLHHMITADVLIGDEQPLSLYAAFARYNRLTVLPVYVPLDSVLVFNQSSQTIEPTPFTRSLTINHLINPHKYRTKRECQDILSEYELFTQMAVFDMIK